MYAALKKSSLRAMALLGPLLLSACANMADTPPGSPLADVQAQFGAPNYSCTTDSGQQRVIWSMQPYGQYAWGAHVDSAGNVDEVVPVLTDAHFNKLSTGRWTADQVLCEYGPPAEREAVGLPSRRQEVWSYRYKQSSVWNSLMYVYFDPNTGVVTRHHPGPDPMYERDRFWFY